MGGALCYRFDMTVESIQIDSDDQTDMSIFTDELKYYKELES